MRSFRLLLSFLFIVLCSFLKAQTLSVESFKLLPNDLTANTFGTMERDQNGEVAALIKIITTETGFVFEAGMLGVVKTVQKVSEIWVYVPYGLQRIKIMHPQLGQCEYNFNIPIDKGRTYELKLISGRLKTVVDDQLMAQFAIIHVIPENATVFVDGTLHIPESDGNVSLLLPFGDHDYRVELPGYKTEAGKFNVGSEKITKEIVLESSKAKVTIKCSMPEAEIWVNQQQYGLGVWSGELTAGMYMVEAKRVGYQTRNTAITVGEKEELSFDVPEPIPVYGHIQIQSTPIDADVYLDGVVVGKTPHLEGNVIGGKHEMIVRKDGYEDYVTEVIVDNSNIVQVNARLIQPTVDSGRKQKSDRNNDKEKKDNDNIDQTFRNNSIYLGGYFAPGLHIGYGAQVGFYFKNFNLQADYIFSEGSIQGYWTETGRTGESVENQSYLWEIDFSASLAIGYGIKMARTIRLTPQLGGMITLLKNINDEQHTSGLDISQKQSYYGGNTYVADVKAVAKLEWIPNRHFSLFAAPGYSFSVKKGGIAVLLDEKDNSVSRLTDGFKASLGIDVYF